MQRFTPSLMARRRSRPFVRPLALMAAALAGFATAGHVRAQAVPGFSLDRFEPAVAGSDWFTLESLDFRGALRPAAAVTGDWAHKPLVLRNGEGDEIDALVERQVFVHARAALVIAHRLRIGLSLPIAVNAAGSAAQVGGLSYASPDGASLGDLRLTADVRLLGVYGGPATLAIGAHLFVPTGSRDDFASDGRVRVAPRAMLAGDLGPIAYAVRVGFQSRRSLDRSLFQNVGVGHQVDAAAALGVRIGRSVLIGPELFGSSVVTEESFLKERATPLELLFGAHVKIARQFQLGAGVSPGLTRGLGSPKLRLLAELQWFPAYDPPPTDRDGDGITDPDDACPDAPGPRTADPKTNGCPPPPPPPPPPDRDRDGVIDAEDACPDEPGPRSDDPKRNGCPPPPDRDKDGIVDAEDACPDIHGVRTDDPRTNGCVDTDGDGIFDPEDACPTVPGPRHEDPAKNGCPLARVEREQIRIIEQVKFKTGSATILPESETILGAVAKIFAEHPEIKKVRVEGHTDDRGTAKYNKALSRRRAASVVRWLTKRGAVAKERLVSEGFGLERPIAPNDSEEGRRENRRVEFHIVDPPPAPAEGATP